MKWIVVLASFWFSTLHVNAGEIAAIVSESRATLTIKAIDKVEFEMFKTVKILSEKGSNHSRLTFYEYAGNEASIYNVIVKDQNDDVVARYSKKDFKKSALIRSLNSYDDINSFNLDCGLKSYPYSVEIHSVVQKKTFFESHYGLSENAGTLLLNASFEVHYPDDYKFNYHFNRPDLIGVDSTVSRNNKILKFDLKGIYENNAESYMPESDRPVVYIIPETFKYGNITGSFNSWNDYGLWVNQLWAGRSELSKSSIDAIDKLIAENPDKSDLAKAIYRYTQQNMRYVSISLGLGGLQTMSAKETSTLGYGDCKALSNFTGAAMNYAGIEAYPALIYGGKRSVKVDPDKPMFSFNHVILCLPTNADTTWLECTSNTSPFGYVSDFTDDRLALILKPSGGELARTPSFSASDNVAIRKTRISLAADGSAAISLNCEYRNLAMYLSNFYLRESSGAKPIKAVKNELNLPSFDLESYASELYKNQVPVLDVACSLKALNVGRSVGTKLLIKPFLIQTFIPSLEADSERIYPVFFKHGYTFNDTISIFLPANMAIIESPGELDETNKYGQISLQSTLDETEGEIQIIRNIRINKGEFKPEEYAELTSFLNLVKASEEFFIILH